MAGAGLVLSPRLSGLPATAAASAATATPAALAIGRTRCGRAA